MLKDFIATFLVCLVVCFIGIFFLGGFILTNPWLLITAIAFFLAIAIKLYTEQETRIAALEKELEKISTINRD